MSQNLELINKINFLIEQNHDLNNLCHKQKIKIIELENGLLELRKIIENVHHERVTSILYEKMTKLLYPQGG